MRRSLFFFIILLCLSSLLARPSIGCMTEAQSPGYTLMAEVVKRVATESLLPRMEGEGELSVYISHLLEPEVNALSAVLLFSYGEKELQLCLSAEAKDSKHLVKELETRLFSMLLYDGRALYEEDDALVVDYTYNQGYASLILLHKGDYYKGLDAEGDRWATVVVQRSFEEDDPVSLLVGLSGKKLLPGMRLEKQSGKSVSLALSRSLASDGQFSVDGMYSQDVGLYPFTLVVGGEFGLANSGLSSVYGKAGFAVHLPLSMLFGIDAGFWRNSSVAMMCTLGIGYSPLTSDILYGSSAVFSYRYTLQSVGLDVGVGNKNWASKTTSSSSGLFMQLGLAYTW